MNEISIWISLELFPFEFFVLVVVDIVAIFLLNLSICFLRHDLRVIVLSQKSVKFKVLLFEHRISSIIVLRENSKWPTP